MSLYVETKLESGLGQINVAVTSATHISASGNVTVNGIVYNVHGHMHQVNGTWAFHNDTNMRINGSYGGNDKRHWNKTPAPTVRAKIVSVYATTLLDYVEAHPEAFLEAAHLKNKYALENAQAKLAKLREQVQAVELEVAELVAEQARTTSIIQLHERYARR